MKIFNKEIEWVVFDKDGTLIDLQSIWIPWLKKISEEIKRRVDLKYEVLEDLKLIFGVMEETQIDPKGPLAIGSIDEGEILVAGYLYQHGVSWDMAILIAKESVTIANKQQNDDKIKLVDGVKEVLEILKNEGIKMGVITADDTDKAILHLEKADIRSYFKFVIGSDLVKRGKPYPDMAFLAKNQYNLNPNKAAMIGDTNADMKMSELASMPVRIGISDSNEGNIHLKNASHHIRSYNELISLLGRKEANHE
ncbi:HAD family hydrolase [Bacillus sp. FJAT-45350]|uniref:HAD family hydrolase n=1 Tax=Bacillus sp. FJAT-45350 TaxID=2011014 RepID=UPI000BB980E4|nr:HAD-IA family hydrolase [Bacillus sp. FJAT-45350]